MQWDPPSWNEPVYSVAFSSDNRHFAAAGAFRSPMVLADIPVWDAYAPTSAPLRLGTGIDAVLVRFSATGARLALTRADGRVEVWNLRNSNTPSAILTGALGTFGPDDNLLACVRGRRTLEIWDLRNTASPKITIASPSNIEHIAYCKTGKLIATAGDDSTVRVWNPENPRNPPQVLAGQTGRVTSLGISAEGVRVAAGSSDGSLAVWDLRHPGSPPLMLPGNQGAVTAVSFSADAGRFAAASADSFVRMWDLAMPNAAPIVFSGHRSAVHEVAISPDGRWLASAGEDTTVRLWPLWQSAADALCLRVWRNFSMDEWKLYLGDSIAYERTCPNLPAGRGAPANAK
jgi:WD40 repeat protein